MKPGELNRPPPPCWVLTLTADAKSTSLTLPPLSVSVDSIRFTLPSVRWPVLMSFSCGLSSRCCVMSPLLELLSTVPARLQRAAEHPSTDYKGFVLTFGALSWAFQSYLV